IDRMSQRYAEHLPVLIGWGLRDVVLDRAMLDEWLRRFPGARACVYPDAGHYVLEDTGYRFLTELRNFMCERR
ncbi:alpha/beta fold hydrolase, partial [Actinomadura sp. LOL_011]|uniref:alpha/beta fold hydrolase n=1 Tax=Actinomadura sp. LOL_011 TaxID=3345410 RepID=UPI003A7F9F7B